MLVILVSGSAFFPICCDAQDEEFIVVKILSNGLIEPSNVPIRRNGDIYEFTDNITGELTVMKNNAIINGKGYVLSGNNKYDPTRRGIWLLSANNITIKNCKFTNIYHPIEITNSSFNTIKSNEFFGTYMGMEIGNHCNNNTITNNNFNSTTDDALFINMCSGNNISYNTISANGFGVFATITSFTQFFQNDLKSTVIFDDRCTNNSIFSNEGDTGIEVFGDNNTVFENNVSRLTLDGHYNHAFGNKVAFFYLKGSDCLVSKNEIISSAVALDFDSGSSSNIIRDNLIISERVGIRSEYTSSEDIIESNVIITKGPGIEFEDTFDTTIIDNSIQAVNSTGISINGRSYRLNINENAIGNCERGISIGPDAHHNVLAHNSITGIRYGIYLYGGKNTTIIENTIKYNVFGVYLESSYVRENWYYNTEVNITTNIISENIGAGIYFNASTKQNLAIRNDIVNNNVGVLIGDDSFGNTFYSNNFVNNNVSVNSFPWRENWSYNSTIGGNYWSDYTGTDNDGDGIVDTKYVIDNNNNDRYPLIEPVVLPLFRVPPALSKTTPTYAPISTDTQYGRVYIWSDGVIEPSIAPIEINGDVYEFTGDINAELIVHKSNIIINGRGHTINGQSWSDGKGISITDLENVTIKNFNIYNFSFGIYLFNCSSVVITANNLSHFEGGIVLEKICNYNIVTNNTLNTARYNSLYLGSSSFNVISNNTIINPLNVALDSEASTDNQISMNHVFSDSRFSTFQFSYYCDNSLIHGNYGQLDIRLSGENNTITENKGGKLSLWGRILSEGGTQLCSNNKVFQNIFSTISLRVASNNVVTENSAVTIIVDDPANNTVCNNTIIDATEAPSFPDKSEDPETSPEVPPEIESPKEHIDFSAEPIIIVIVIGVGVIVTYAIAKLHN